MTSDQDKATQGCKHWAQTRELVPYIRAEEDELECAECGVKMKLVPLAALQRPGREAELVEALRKATAHVGFLKSCVMSGESFYIEDLATLAEWSKEAQALISPPGLSTG